MESRALTRKDLEPYIGSRARVAEVLNRVRPLPLEMIRRLSEGLEIPADVLVRRYELTEARVMMRHGERQKARPDPRLV